ncbi:amidohydrolase family protein [Methylobacterium indicum]|uniref:amidohydrolase family protein n=1 Tax=Methylobacterium indicum TaxID=1775910 RepID=UPI002434B0A3|nr:amidohydrolase [Methylobacterium indicum]
MDDFPIIDPHHHLWDLDKHYYPWLTDGPKPIVFGDYSPIIKNYRIEDFLKDARNQNVVKSVHLDVGFDPRDPVGETRWLQGVADAHGFPHGIVGYADLASPGVRDVLEGHRAFPNFRGIRQSLNYHPDPVKTYLERPGLSREPDWRRGFGLLRDLDMSFDLQLYYPQMEEAYDLARAFPDTQIILNHTGMQVDGMDHFDAWKAGMHRLAAAPNVACKISGLGMGDWTWTTDSIRPYVLEAIAAFGVDRCMFASNFPVDKLFSSYDRIFDAFKAITASFPTQDRRKLFHDNAERFYRL